MREHKIITKGAATELEKEYLGSIIGEDWSSIQFQSAAPKTGDLSVPRSHDHQPGEASRTSEFILVLPDPRTQQILASSSSSLDPGDGSPVSTAPLGRRTTRATSVGLLPPPAATAIVADYQAMYAQSLWEGPPEDSREYISFLARIVRAMDNPTLLVKLWWVLTMTLSGSLP